MIRAVALIPPHACAPIWRRYEQYCREKELTRFSETSLGIWAYDIAIKRAGNPSPAPEVELVRMIIQSAAAPYPLRDPSIWAEPQISRYN